MSTQERLAQISQLTGTDSTGAGQSVSVTVGLIGVTVDTIRHPPPPPKPPHMVREEDDGRGSSGLIATAVNSSNLVNIIAATLRITPQQAVRVLELTLQEINEVGQQALQDFKRGLG